MRAPPPVTCHSALQGAWRVAYCGVLALSAAVLAGWLLAFVQPTRPDLALLAALLAAAVAGAWAGFIAPRGTRTLAWDGRAWSLHVERAPVAMMGELHLVLDLGPWILLRFHADGTAHWLPLAAARDPAGWPLLRAVLWTWRPREAAP